MNCGSVQRRLWDEGPLAAEVVEHLAACPKCAACQAKAAQVFEMLAEANPIEDAGNLLPEIRTRLTRIGTPPSMFSMRALTAIAVTVMTLSLAWWSQGSRAHSPVTVAGFGVLDPMAAGGMVASHRAGEYTDYRNSRPGMLAASDLHQFAAPRSAPMLNGVAVASPAATVPGTEPAAAVSVSAAAGASDESGWEARGYNPVTGECTLTRVRTITDAQGRVLTVEVTVIALP